MSIETSTKIEKEILLIESLQLGRTVRVDLYLTGAQEAAAGRETSTGAGADAPTSLPSGTSLLLLNDGQDLERLGLAAILDDLYGRGAISPLLCAGIHAGDDRKMEYGTAGRLDYQGWGGKADAYTRFIFEELIPAIRYKYREANFREKAFAGFSLGALSALDIVWHHPQEFSRAGLFSGSFWWRTKDKSDPSYDEHTDRIMPDEVRKGEHYPWLKFFFECGTEDEAEDRDGNGIIDSIDDTRALMDELVEKGYDRQRDIRYLEIPGGHHDVATWARAMPEFLLWGWGR